MRVLVGALGGWLAALALLGWASRLAGGSSEALRALLPDQWILRTGFGVSDAPLALSLLHGLVLLAVAGRMPPVRRPALALVLAAALAVNGLGLELAGFRLARQVRTQWGWSDQRIRDAWSTWQGFDPADFARVRAAVGPRETVLFRLDDHPGSEPLARFMGFALLPSPSYLGTPPQDRRATTWGAPPPTDWVVDVAGARVTAIRRARPRGGLRACSWAGLKAGARAVEVTAIGPARR